MSIRLVISNNSLETDYRIFGRGDVCRRQSCTASTERKCKAREKYVRIALAQSIHVATRLGECSACSDLDVVPITFQFWMRLAQSIGKRPSYRINGCYAGCAVDGLEAREERGGTDLDGGGAEGVVFGGDERVELVDSISSSLF
jgi:hypothetical protein